MYCLLPLWTCAVPSNDLAARTRDYFRRQIRWFEQLLAELRDLDPAAQGPQQQARVESQAETNARFTKEFEDLMIEWDRSGVSPEARPADLRDLARRAEALTVELHQTYEHLTRQTTHQAAQVKAALTDLGRGRGLLRKYRQADRNDTAFIDRKA